MIVWSVPPQNFPSHESRERPTSASRTDLVERHHRVTGVVGLDRVEVVVWVDVGDLHRLARLPGGVASGQSDDAFEFGNHFNNRLSVFAQRR